MEAIVPKPLTSNNKAKGQFDRREFIYKAEVNMSVPQDNA